MKVESKNVRINTLSYYVDVNEDAVIFMQDNFDLFVNRLWISEYPFIDCIASAQYMENTLIVGSTKWVSEKELSLTINDIFNKFFAYTYN